MAERNTGSIWRHKTRTNSPLSAGLCVEADLSVRPLSVCLGCFVTLLFIVFQVRLQSKPGHAVWEKRQVSWYTTARIISFSRICLTRPDQKKAKRRLFFAKILPFSPVKPCLRLTSRGKGSKITYSVVCLVSFSLRLRCECVALAGPLAQSRPRQTTDTPNPSPTAAPP